MKSKQRTRSSSLFLIEKLQEYYRVPPRLLIDRAFLLLCRTRASLSGSGVAITSACIRRVPVDSDGVSKMVEGVGTGLTWGLSSSIQAYVTPFCHTATASGLHVFLRMFPLQTQQHRNTLYCSGVSIVLFFIFL